MTADVVQEGYMFSNLDPCKYDTIQQPNNLMKVALAAYPVNMEMSSGGLIEIIVGLDKAAQSGSVVQPMACLKQMLLLLLCSNNLEYASDDLKKLMRDVAQANVHFEEDSIRMLFHLNKQTGLFFEEILTGLLGILKYQFKEPCFQKAVELTNAFKTLPPTQTEINHRIRLAHSQGFVTRKVPPYIPQPSITPTLLNVQKLWEYLAQPGLIRLAIKYKGEMNMLKKIVYHVLATMPAFEKPIWPFAGMAELESNTSTPLTHIIGGIIHYNSLSPLPTRKDKHHHFSIDMVLGIHENEITDKPRECIDLICFLLNCEHRNSLLHTLKVNKSLLAGQARYIEINQVPYISMEFYLQVCTQTDVLTISNLLKSYLDDLQSFLDQARINTIIREMRLRSQSRPPRYLSYEEQIFEIDKISLKGKPSEASPLTQVTHADVITVLKALAQTSHWVRYFQDDFVHMNADWIDYTHNVCYTFRTSPIHSLASSIGLVSPLLVSNKTESARAILIELIQQTEFQSRHVQTVTARTNLPSGKLVVKAVTFLGSAPINSSISVEFDLSPTLGITEYIEIVGYLLAYLDKCRSSRLIARVDLKINEARQIIIAFYGPRDFVNEGMYTFFMQYFKMAAKTPIADKVSLIDTKKAATLYFTKEFITSTSSLRSFTMLQRTRREAISPQLCLDHLATINYLQPRLIQPCRIQILVYNTKLNPAVEEVLKTSLAEPAAAIQTQDSGKPADVSPNTAAWCQVWSCSPTGEQLFRQFFLTKLLVHLLEHLTATSNCPDVQSIKFDADVVNQTILFGFISDKKNKSAQNRLSSITKSLCNNALAILKTLTVQQFEAYKRDILFNAPFLELSKLQTPIQLIRHWEHYWNDPLFVEQLHELGRCVTLAELCQFITHNPFNFHQEPFVACPITLLDKDVDADATYQMDSNNIQASSTAARPSVIQSHPRRQSSNDTTSNNTPLKRAKPS
ncbi:hypothetical protein NEHOM01_0857 [Nematocida homosporus]|uniref:uncharacterized protein n=1 Tax=Nematocida homosporus TaxID=1912981 RepID=UPI0022204AC3|nr:uncharacterized protein NEHOM01_0857 [Nematocida homosporus]KAI5185498.1 hypothetical protein NEHOM01_0857 [Nematocida homosporus]